MRLKIMLGAGFAAALAASTGLVAPLSLAQAVPRRITWCCSRGPSPDGAARAAITRSGGTVREVNSKIGYAYVTTTRSDFATSLTRSGAVVGVAAERSIGSAGESRRARSGDVERLAKERAAAPGTGVADARARHRGHDRSPPSRWPGCSGTCARSARRPPARTQGTRAQEGPRRHHRHRHRRHPPGHRAELRQGAEPQLRDRHDRHRRPLRAPGCVDPADEDDDGHGTHVASTIGSPINGLGIAGVAPKA